MRQPESGRAARRKRALHSRNFTLYTGFSSIKKHGLKLAIGVRAGTSTVRNKAKRYAREAFRLNRNRFPADIEIVISAKNDISALSRRDLRGQIHDLFEQAYRLLLQGSPQGIRSDDSGKSC